MFHIMFQTLFGMFQTLFAMFQTLFYLAIVTEKINQIFGFPCCSTREDLSIDASITNVELILTKLR